MSGIALYLWMRREHECQEKKKLVIHFGVARGLESGHGLKIPRSKEVVRMRDKVVTALWALAQHPSPV